MSRINTNNLRQLNASVDNISLDSSGNVAIQGGAAATPSLHFSGDDDTGIYSPGADSVAISTGGSARATVDSSGRVGIGNTNPGDYSSVADDLVVGNLSGAHGITIAAENNNTGYLRFADGTANSGQQANGFVQYSHADLSLRFGVDAQERVRIDSSGRLLIGTSTAASNYRVGTTSFTPKVQAEGTDVSPLAIQRTDGPPHLFIATGVNVASGGDIGKISFNAKDGTNLVQAATIGAECDGTPGVNDMPGRLVFSTTADGASSPTERMRITQNGCFHASSDVADSSRYGNTINHSFSSSIGGQWAFAIENNHNTNPFGMIIDFDDASPDNTNNYFLNCRDSTATRMEIRSDGDVWTSDSGVLTSDATLKRDITDATPKLDDLMRLRVRNFYWIPEYHPNKQDKKLIGFIAQEVEEVFPGLISNDNRISGGDPIFDEEGNDTGEKTPKVLKKGLKEAKLIPILVKALQEAVERIETLETANASQAAAIAALDARLTALEGA